MTISDKAPASRRLRFGAVALVAAAALLLASQAPATPFAAVFGNGRGLSIAALANAKSVGRSGALAYDINVVRHTPALYQQLRKARFSFVRQVVTPLPLMQPDNVARDAAIAQVLSVVDQIRARGIAVVIDLHFWSPSNETAETMLANPVRQESFARGVVAMGRALGSRKGVALELLNEPPLCQAGKAMDWAMVQRRLVARVRAVAPALPLVLTGCGGQLNGLIELDPAPYARDANVLYTFHFYEPFIFTHQQTYYGGKLRSVPFPPPGPGWTGDRIATIVSAELLAARKKTADELKAYLQGRDNEVQIAARIDQAARWAQRHRIAAGRILLGEFGSTLSADTDAEAVRSDQLHWVKLVRDQAERAHFAWAYWSLPSSNALDYDPRTNFLRNDLLHALGAPTTVPVR